MTTILLLSIFYKLYKKEIKKVIEKLTKFGKKFFLKGKKKLKLENDEFFFILNVIFLFVISATIIIKLIF